MGERKVPEKKLKISFVKSKITIDILIKYLKEHPERQKDFYVLGWLNEGHLYYLEEKIGDLRDMIESRIFRHELLPCISIKPLIKQLRTEEARKKTGIKHDLFTLIRLDLPSCPYCGQRYRIDDMIEMVLSGKTICINKSQCLEDLEVFFRDVIAKYIAKNIIKLIN